MAKKKKTPIKKGPAQSRIRCPKCGNPRSRRATGVQAIEGRVATCTFVCEMCETSYRSLEIRLPVRPNTQQTAAIKNLLTTLIGEGK